MLLVWQEGCPLKPGPCATKSRRRHRPSREHSHQLLCLQSLSVGCVDDCQTQEALGIQSEQEDGTEAGEILQIIADVDPWLFRAGKKRGKKRIVAFIMAVKKMCAKEGISYYG